MPRAENSMVFPAFGPAVAPWDAAAPTVELPSRMNFDHVWYSKTSTRPPGVCTHANNSQHLVDSRLFYSPAHNGAFHPADSQVFSRQEKSGKLCWCAQIVHGVALHSVRKAWSRLLGEHNKLVATLGQPRRK